MNDFDVSALPAQRWADEVDRFAYNIRHDPSQMAGDGFKQSNMDERITFVASRITSKFEIRYGRSKYNDAHSLNATKTLMIYNPHGGIWMPYASVADVLTSCLNKNLSADSHVEALADAIAATLGTPVPRNTVPAPYSGTRYQLFLNGIYDLEDDIFLVFGEDVTDETELHLKRSKVVPVKDMGFTEKHMHSIIYSMTPADPVFEDELVTKDSIGDWDFRVWMRKVCGDDERRTAWLTYIIALASLPSVNIGVNLLLRGDSGSGKSTIGTLISALYTGPDDGLGYLYDATVGELVSNQHKADTMNEDFPFRGSLTPKMNFVHLSEMNGIYMNESAGALFDKFADNVLDGKRLHSSSFRLSPTPTLFMEGTKWPKFDTVKNGVERRALPVALTPTADLQDYAADSMDKHELFSHELILTWLMRECHKELRMRHAQRSNIRLNLLKEELPEFVEEWRAEIMSGGGEMHAFYQMIEGGLMTGRPISFEMLHDLYIMQSERRGVKYTKSRISFTESMSAKFENHGYRVTMLGHRFVESDLSSIGLDVGYIAESVPLPQGLTISSYNEFGYGKFKSDDWFVLEKAN